MKAILVIDIPVDESCEIDEYGMIADLKIRPTTLTNREELFFELKNVEVKPMPDKIDQGYPCSTYDEGYGDGFDKCIDEILGEENG